MATIHDDSKLERRMRTKCYFYILLCTMFFKHLDSFSLHKNLLKINVVRTNRILFSSTTSDEKYDERQQHKITWQTSKGKITFNAYDGELLRSAALRSGRVVSPHNGRANLINCRGLGTCGTCAVEIHDSDSGCVEPKTKNSIESFRLSVPPGHGSESSMKRLRLSCQVQIRGDLNVTKYEGFWGQHVDVIAEGSIPSKPFGKIEYILDRKSPNSEKT